MKNTIVFALLLVSLSAWAADPVPLEQVKPQQITAAELPYSSIPDGVLVSVTDRPGDLRIGNEPVGTGVFVPLAGGKYWSFTESSGAAFIGGDTGAKISFEENMFYADWSFNGAVTLGGVMRTNWPEGSDGISADTATNIAQTVLAASTNAHDGTARASIVAVGSVASNATTEAEAGQIATNAVGHGLAGYYPVAYATSIAINPSNGYKQALYLAGTTTVSVAGGATNQMGSLRLDVLTGTNQHLFTNPVPAGTWSTTAVNTVIYSKPAHATAWTARVFTW